MPYSHCWHSHTRTHAQNRSARPQYHINGSHTLSNPPADTHTADRQARRQRHGSEEADTAVRKREMKDMSIFGVSRALKKTVRPLPTYDRSCWATATKAVPSPTKRFWNDPHLLLVVASSALSPHTRDAVNMAGSPSPFSAHGLASVYTTEGMWMNLTNDLTPEIAWRMCWFVLWLVQQEKE
ncbi:unnamed protein product [Leuciscus chuanchicus]